jgi:site-specific recombinase XerC
MTVDDVELDQRMVWVLGKGHRPRALPLGRKPAQALDRYLRVREERRLAYLPNLWVGRNGPMTSSGVYQVVHDRARAAGLPATNWLAVRVSRRIGAPHRWTASAWTLDLHTRGHSEWSRTAE